MPFLHHGESVIIYEGFLRARRLGEKENIGVLVELIRDLAVKVDLRASCKEERRLVHRGDDAIGGFAAVEKAKLAKLLVGPILDFIRGGKTVFARLCAPVGGALERGIVHKHHYVVFCKTNVDLDYVRAHHNCAEDAGERVFGIVLNVAAVRIGCHSAARCGQGVKLFFIIGHPRGGGEFIRPHGNEGFDVEGERIRDQRVVIALVLKIAVKGGDSSVLEQRNELFNRRLSCQRASAEEDDLIVLDADHVIHIADAVDRGFGAVGRADEDLLVRLVGILFICHNLRLRARKLGEP